MPAGHALRRGGWRVASEPAAGGDREESFFDAVIVCNGHYSVPRLAEVAGLSAFTGAGAIASGTGTSWAPPLRFLQNK